MDKVKNKEVTAIILALAGINRLKIEIPYSILDYEECMPAASQGIIGITYLKSNIKVQTILSKLINIKTQYQAIGERAVLNIINGDCHSPIAVTSSIISNRISISAKIFSIDGKNMIEQYKTDITENSEMLGKDIGNNLIKMGALELLKLWKIIHQNPMYSF